MAFLELVKNGKDLITFAYGHGRGERETEREREGFVGEMVCSICSGGIIHIQAGNYVLIKQRGFQRMCFVSS